MEQVPDDEQKQHSGMLPKTEGGLMHTKMLFPHSARERDKGTQEKYSIPNAMPPYLLINLKLLDFALQIKFEFFSYFGVTGTIS